ncbi:extracellular solute-binding protein [Natronosalvus halobius]|uniref:extracellular solute-binding protein n=1 Tax=Natronosalvus halobius TaxID=2953746 RepID=UPI0020A1F744|nr:extracellular solute-binding protein [Natronosalvus halobius]USZ70233.1 extracellular solute-binding protein [Natronosalvus halobius]
MDRRTLVKYLAGASAAGALAGCISTEDPSGNGDGNGNGDGDGNGNGNGNGEYEDDEDWPTVEPEGVSGEAELWHDLSEGEQDSFDSYIEEFNDSYDITISPEAVSELEDQTTASIPAGDGPELFVWAHDWVGKYYENGFLSDQSDNLNIDPEEYFGENANSARYDGATLGLPFAAETVALVYNKEYVDEAPETFEEVLEVAEEYHAPEDNTYGFTWPMDAYHVSAFPHGFGGYYYDEESGELGLTNDETIAGFQYVIDNVWDYMPADPGGEAQQSVFIEGNSPFLITGPWNLGNFEDNDLDYGIAPWPEVEGNEPSPFTGVQLFYFAAAMDEDQERADSAIGFAEWYTTNTSLIAEQADKHGFIPVHNAFADDGEESGELSENLQGFSAAVNQGNPMPTAADFQAVWEPLETEWFEALNGNKSVEDAMADAESQIQDAWN